MAKKIEAPYYIKNPFNLTDAQAEKILTESYQDTFKFSKYFLPDFSKTRSPFYHPLIFKQFDAPDNKPIAMIITRDGSKTTITKAMSLKRLLFAKKAEEWGLGPRRYEFIGWSSSSKPKSENQMIYIQTFIEHSPIIKYFFGSLKGKRWSLSLIETIYGDTMRATSNLIGLRGDTVANIQSGAERYSLIISDDSENEMNTLTPDARDKFNRLIIDGMLPAIERNQLSNRFVFINTPIHYAGFTQDMIELYFEAKGNEKVRNNLLWKIIYIPAILPMEEGKEYKENEIVKSDILPQGIYAWPDRLGKQRLEEAYLSAEQSPAGIASFYKEYMLEVQSEEQATLGRRVLKYHDAEFFIENGRPYIRLGDEIRAVNVFLGCDPATDIKTKDSDFSVVLAIAVDAYDNVYVLHYERHRSLRTQALRDKNFKQIGSNGVVEYLWTMYDNFSATHAAVEDVAMTRSVFQAIDQLEEAYNNHSKHWIHVKPLGQEKINKIYTFLNPLFSAGKIHIRRGMTALETEIIRFGKKMAHDDTIESLYFACRHRHAPVSEEKRVKKIEKRKKQRKKPWYLL